MCSPYLPDCLRPERTTTRTNRPFSDFSELAHVAAAGGNTLREEGGGNTHVVVSGLKILTSQVRSVRSFQTTGKIAFFTHRTAPLGFNI